MRKSNKGKKANSKTKAKVSTAAKNSPDIKKRNFLSKIRNASIGLVIAGGIGFYFYSAYQKDLEEKDLTKIGKGTPYVVQIHDPNCPVCTALQKQTRSALSQFDKNKLGYLVADIKTKRGREFANKYQVPHITLLLFDERGRLKQTLQGMRQEADLTPIFATIAKRR